MKLALVLSFLLLSLSVAAQTERGPNSVAESIYAQGFMLMQNGQYNDAKKHFILAIKMDSTDLNFYLSIAKIGYRTSNWTLADSIYTAAKKAFPDNSDIYMYAGDAYQNQLKLKLAVDNYSKAIEINNNSNNPQLYLYHLGRGNSYLQMKQYHKAILDYDKTLQLVPAFVDALTNRGVAKYYNKDKVGACNDWKKALENGNNAVDSYIKQYCN